MFFLATVVFLIQALGKITPNGVYLEQLETEPWKYMPEINESLLHDDVVKVVCVYKRS